MQRPSQYHGLFSFFPGASARANAVTGSFKRFILTPWHELQHLSMSQGGLGKRKDGKATAGWRAAPALPAVPRKGLRCTASLGAAPQPAAGPSHSTPNGCVLHASERAIN